MIIFRYLIKEIMLTVAATTAILLLIFLSTQFVHYLGDAAFGRFTTGILLHIMILQVPYLLGLLMPLGFYLAILTAYGRLYADQEMIVLNSCGVSQGQILGMTLGFAAVLAVLVAILTCWVSPYVQRAQKQLMEEAKSAPLVETIMPGRFYSMNGGKQVFYIEDISRDHRQLNNIFAAQQASQDSNDWNVVSAENGYQLQKQGHQLIIQNGYRYAGTPGNNAFQQQHFVKLRWFLTQEPPVLGQRPEILSLPQLWKIRNADPLMAAELQWRLSMPLSVILLTLLAVPLSKVNPRQGKFAQLLPAILIYIFYANMMFVGRDWIQSGALPAWIGLWWLHGILLLLALGIMFLRSNAKTIFRKKYLARQKPVNPAVIS